MDFERIASTYRQTRRKLLEARGSNIFWEGRLSASALSTATAVSALALVAREGKPVVTDSQTVSAELLNQLVRRGLTWLAEAQCPDGGWGDTDRSYSNVATTMLCLAAFRLADSEGENSSLVAQGGKTTGGAVGDFGSEKEYSSRVARERKTTGGAIDDFDSERENSSLLARGDAYLERVGGVAALRARFGRDKTFAVPILANAALAGQVPWSEVAALPFEFAALPQTFYRWMHLPVVSYAVPALVAIGQLRHRQRPSRNPLLRWVRNRAVAPSLRALERMQPESGGYLEAVPLTSFVVMSLASMERTTHPVACRGVRFLCESVGDDGSWPIDTNLATWNSSLAVHALLGDSNPPGDKKCLSHEGERTDPECDLHLPEFASWLLDCQQTERHPFTGAAPGGWGWTHLTGAVPDADDTSGALLALRRITDSGMISDEALGRRITEAARSGVAWLLQLQNRDGGWPTFCRGWGRFPFDRSGSDLTAHAIRALHAWSHVEPKRVGAACERGWRFLISLQQPDGSWLPLWFGNQDHPREENPWYGTAKVLLAYADAWKGQLPTTATRGTEFLIATQLGDGCWGGRGPSGDPNARGSLEETALCVEALARLQPSADARKALNRGVEGLVTAMEAGQWHEASPIGFYFAKLWYYEELYPLLFATSALRAVLESLG